MTYEWAKPGVKVVCINDNQDTEWNVGCRTDDTWNIVEGRIYTIRSTFVPLHGRTPLALRLVELYRPPLGGKGPDSHVENGFNVVRFRPLIDKRLPDSLTILLEKPNRLIVPDGGKWDIKPREEVKVR